MIFALNKLVFFEYQFIKELMADLITIEDTNRLPVIVRQYVNELRSNFPTDNYFLRASDIHVLFVLVIIDFRIERPYKLNGICC